MLLAHHLCTFKSDNKTGLDFDACGLRWKCWQVVRFFFLSASQDIFSDSYSGCVHVLLRSHAWAGSSQEKCFHVMWPQIWKGHIASLKKKKKKKKKSLTALLCWNKKGTNELLFKVAANYEWADFSSTIGSQELLERWETSLFSTVGHTQGTLTFTQMGKRLCRSCRHNQEIHKNWQERNVLPGP